MSHRSSVQHLLNRTYLKQLLLVSAAVVLGIWTTALVLEHVLVKEALKQEASHYWALYEANPQQPRPDTNNLQGYLRTPSHSDVIPPALKNLAPGYRRVSIDDKNPLVYIEDRGPARLYLAFDENSVSMLALLFGILPLTAALLIIYLSSYITWRRSQKLMSPLVQLANTLRKTLMTDPNASKPDFSGLQVAAGSEIEVLVSALDGYSERLVGYIEREKMFTRDASHELRTPLAVVKANLELLLVRWGELPQLKRIEDTLGDMEAVIDTLLALARNEREKMPQEALVVNDLLVNLIERLQPLAERKQQHLEIKQTALLTLVCSEPLLTMVLTNLIRNAINYSGSSQVELVVTESAIWVSDQGGGMAADELELAMKPFERGAETTESGHGLGLAIVRRLCEQCEWQLDVASVPGQGTQVGISFPASQRRPGGR